MSAFASIFLSLSHSFTFALSPLHLNSHLRIFPPRHPNASDLYLLLGALLRQVRKEFVLSLHVHSVTARLLQPLALSIVDVWTAPHTLVHTLGSQLRGLKDGQYLLWERPGTRSALTALITSPLTVRYTSHSPSRKPV